MSILIKGMEMPKDCATCHFCHTENFRAWCCITDEDIEITDMTAVQEDCPLSETPEPCEDDKGCSNCMYSGRPTYKSPCSECRNNSQWEMKPISRSYENGVEREDAVSREQVLKLFSTHDGKYLYEAIQMLPSVTLKLDHSGDVTEMVEYDDCVSRQAVIDTARKVSSIFEGEYDTRTPYGVVLDVQDAVSKLPSVTPKRKKWKWIKYDSDEDKYDVIKCPCCKHTFTVDAYHWTDIGFVKDDFKFCPNCSADMRGKQDE